MFGRGLSGVGVIAVVMLIVFGGRIPPEVSSAIRKGTQNREKTFL